MRHDTVQSDASDRSGSHLAEAAQAQAQARETGSGQPADPDPMASAAQSAASASAVAPPVEVNPDHLPGALKRKAIKGAFWVGVGQIAGQGLRLVNNLILTRLIDQSLIGMMVPVNSVIRGLQMMSDVGIRHSMVQDPQGDEPHFYNTAWTVSIIRGIILTLAAIPTAFVFGYIYGQSELYWVIPIAGVATAIIGFRSTAQYSLNRRIDIQRITLFALAAQITTLCLTVMWAFFDPSIRALVAGVLASSLCNTVFSFYMIPGYRNTLKLDRETIRKIWHFAKWMLPGTALAFISAEAYVLIMYPLIPATMKGAFAVAVLIVGVPRVMAGRISNEVIFPAVSRKQHLDRVELRRKILENRGKVLYLAALALACLAGLGDLIIRVLWTKDYDAAGWMMPVMVLGIWPLLLYRTTLPALEALRELSYNTWGNLSSIVVIVVGIPAAYFLFENWGYLGVLGALIAVSFNEIPSYAFIAWGMWKNRLSTLRQDMVTTGVFAGLLALIITARVLLNLGVPVWDDAIKAKPEVVPQAAAGDADCFRQWKLID